jgi:hypothetical protein
MIILIVLLSALFLGIMVPAVMIPLFKKTTVRLLEALRLYEKGTLFVERRTGITGAGYQREMTMYLKKVPGGDSFETGRVFGLMLLVFEALFLVLGVLLILYLKLVMGL